MDMDGVDDVDGEDGYIDTEGFDIDGFDIDGIRENYIHQSTFDPETADWEDVKIEALNLLDVMTCPYDEDDPEYDVSKDLRRDNILLQNDYEHLKIELRSRGLRTNGDKPEMIMRLLLNIIDPSVKFNAQSGIERQLEYVSEDDILDGDVEVIAEDMRSQRLLDGPDADDVAALKPRKNKKSKSRVPRMQSINNWKYDDKNEKLVMDGLTRRELEFEPLEITRSSEVVQNEDKDRTIRAYVSGGRDVLRTWERRASVTVVLPDERGWRDKDVRTFADEIAFNNQAIVIVPDIHAAGGGSLEASQSHADATVEEWFNNFSDSSRMNTLTDDVIATLHFARVNYDSKTVTLAGLGHGGGIALEISSYFGKMDNILNDKSYQFQSILQNDKIEESRNIQEDIEHISSEDTAYHHEVVNAQQSSRLVNANLLSDGCTLSIQTLKQINPKAVFAVTPQGYDINRVCKSLCCPTFVTFGEYGVGTTTTSAAVRKGSNLMAAKKLYNCLQNRSTEIKDFSLRIYESCGGLGDSSAFIHRCNLLTEHDQKASQEAISIGSIWLDIFSRDDEDATSGMGTMKLDNGLVIVRKEDLINPVRSSAIASYLHEDPNFVKNLRLEGDNLPSHYTSET
jgi:hypothetical protein